MSSRNWKAVAKLTLQANVPTLLWGGPGIGKTSFALALGEGMGLPVEVVISSIREPSDFLGLPVVTEEGVMMSPARWAKRLLEAGQGIVVFDEITTAPPAVQHALLRVVLEGVVGDVRLPAAVRTLAIANPAEESGGWDLTLPLRNRFVHVEATAPSPEEWADGLAKGWPKESFALGVEPTPGDVQVAKGKVGGFLRHRRELLYQKPSGDVVDVNGWPSPRSWEMFSRLLSYTRNQDLVHQCAVGCVGPGAAREFSVWVAAADLPSPEFLLEKPKRFSTSRSDIAFATLAGVVGYTLDRLNEEEEEEAKVIWSRCWEVLGQACKVGVADVAAAQATRLIEEGHRSWLPRPAAIKEFGAIKGLE
jgi:hypothetical protein